MGPKILDIPIEEVFFFVIQTYNTTLLYLILNKPTLHSIYLVREKKGSAWKVLKLGGQLVLGLIIKKSFDWVKTPGQYTYMGLILVWARIPCIPLRSQLCTSGLSTLWLCNVVLG
jgi:15-cis-phytoene synthase/lycopene beta-cyclase